MNLNSSPTNPALFLILLDRQKQTSNGCGASSDGICIPNAACRFISAGSVFLLPGIQKGSKKMNVPTIDIVQTGANIKALRKAAGIKVKDVADTLGVSTQAVAKWQAGTALPTIDNLVILAAMLNTKIDDILVIA